MTCYFKAIIQWLLSACTSQATQVGAHYRAAPQPKSPASGETKPAQGTSILWGLKLHTRPEPAHGDGDTEETPSPPSSQQLCRLCLALALPALALLPTHQLFVGPERPAAPTAVTTLATRRSSLHADPSLPHALYRQQAQALRY